MPAEIPIAEPDLRWAHRVWVQLQRWECEGLLYAALKFSLCSPSSGYVESMALKTWEELGSELQKDLARLFRKLQYRFGIVGS